MSSQRSQITESASISEEHHASEHKRSWTYRILHELKRFAGMFLYLYILFGLFLLHESIVLAKHEITFTHYGFAFINAWILAKVMLVAEDLNIARGFEDKPLIYPVLYKSVVFAVVFIVFYVLEEVLIGLWQGKTVMESIPEVGGGSLTGILSAGLIVTFALSPYFAFREVGRVIGRDKLRALFLTRKPEAGAAASIAAASGRSNAGS